MYLVDKETFEKLPDEAQSMIKESCQGVNDPEVEAKIEAIAERESPKDEMEEGPDGMEKMKYGSEGEYEDEFDDTGKMKEYPESKKNGIKSFDEASNRGIELLIAMGKKPMKGPMGKDKVEKIPEEE